MKNTNTNTSSKYSYKYKLKCNLFFNYYMYIIKILLYDFDKTFLPKISQFETKQNKIGIHTY